MTNKPSKTQREMQKCPKCGQESYVFDPQTKRHRCLRLKCLYEEVPMSKTQEKKKVFPFQCQYCGRFVRIIDSGRDMDGGWWVLFRCSKCGEQSDGA